jgi:hypothetical protein
MREASAVCQKGQPRAFAWGDERPHAVGTDGYATSVFLERPGLGR